MCQPEEVKGLRCTRQAAFQTSVAGKALEVYEPCLLRMQFQLEPRESFAKVSQEPLCIEFMLEAKHEVIAVAHDDDVTMRMPLSPLPHPQVKRIV